MLETIVQCRKCNLCSNQPPLLDSVNKCQVMWVGLSSKKIKTENETPLSVTTNTGKIIQRISENSPDTLMYRTNLVKCLPLDENSKLRYPIKKEMETCFENLTTEINYFTPKIVFILGGKVTKTFENKLNIKFEKIIEFDYKYKIHNNTYYIPIHHPSYIHIYKSKNIDQYVNSVNSIIKTLI